MPLERIWVAGFSGKPDSKRCGRHWMHDWMIPPEDNRADETARPFGKESIAGLIHQFTAEFSRAKVDVAVESFLGRFFPEQFDKNDYFVRSGDLCTRLGFVTEGVIRAFHSTDQGEEYTKTVFPEGHFVAPLAALTTGEASPVSLQALTPVKMLVADYRELQSLLHNHHCLEHFTRMVIQWK